MDLAGNERADRTGNTGQRMEESKAINKSLFNLQACLRELRWNQQNAADKEPRNVPYRASKVMLCGHLERKLSLLCAPWPMRVHL